ncbi:DUF4858 domain-containing protein [Bacteroides mediterraneensis]|uniref:DUF4858 domain-containing protein n=1 Tax=Bacteroides mediterraneensis TaxID=1841856 RepID=UPI0026EC65CE|nr:DUF4858 domain-containing protein [Bacteroides mediterraneensis]
MDYASHLSSKLTLFLCAAGILPGMAQQQEKELQLNMDAVKMIQFDFDPSSKPENKPLEAPLDKKWMDFKVDLKVPRSLIDTTKVKKPEGYVRMEPYTIWTRFGEDPVYDVLVTGRPKKWEISWTLNPNRVYRDENYGRSLMPSTGRIYRDLNAPIGPTFAIGGLDFIGFLYDNLSPRGRMLAHNRKHANAWKTYADYVPTAADSLKVPNFYRYTAARKADTIRTMLPSQPAFSGAPLLPVYATPDSVKATQSTAKPDTLEVQKKKNPQPAREEDAGNLYEYIRRKEAEDSIRRKEFLRKDRIRNNQYDVQREIQRLRDRQN